MKQQTKEVLKTEFKLFLAEALIQLIGYKQEALVFGLLNLDTRQRHILRERRRMTADLWRRVIRKWSYRLLQLFGISEQLSLARLKAYRRITWLVFTAMARQSGTICRHFAESVTAVKAFLMPIIGQNEYEKPKSTKS